MPSYVGWCPNVVGRLSFSRIGDKATGTSLICNLTRAPDSFLFGVQRRVSRDGALPARVRRFLGEYPFTEYAIFLEIKPADLPHPIDVADTKSANDGAKGTTAPPIELARDDRGTLVGTVIFINGSEGAQTELVNLALDKIRSGADLAYSTDEAQTRRQIYESARSEAEKLFSDLKARFHKGDFVPNFGRASVRLDRTGECPIEVNPRELYTTEQIWDAQIAGDGSDLWNAFAEEIESECLSVAEQSFYLIRDLAHRHYHHNPHADMITTVFRRDGDDETWRRETQYGLVRAIFATRRADTAEAYRQSLGLIGYAESFQRHLCGWKIADGLPTKSNIRFKYDFTSLKSSIDSSLKARESADGARKTRLVFCYAALITTATLIFPSYRDRVSTDGLNFTQAIFQHVANFVTTHPIEALTASLVISWVVDLVFLRIATRPHWLQAWGGGLERWAYSCMADRRVAKAAGTAQRHVLIWYGAFVLLGVGGVTLILWLSWTLWTYAISLIR